jgi:hypothetical protein
LNSKYTLKDILLFFALYILAIISVYYMPKALTFIYFAILLVLFWRSEKNAFWFLLFYFMLDPPADLFPTDYNYGLPFIKGVNVRFLELFTYVAFLKALRKKTRFISLYNKSYRLLIILTAVLIIYTLFLDTSVLSLLISVKTILVWSLIYSTAMLIDTFDEWVFFFRICFIIVFIGFLSQILFLVLGHSPSYLLGTDFQPMMIYGKRVVASLNPSEYDVKVARPVSCISIMLIALIGSLFFLKLKKEFFLKKYLYTVIIVAYMSIIITATRGWFIAFSFVLILYVAFMQKFRRTASIAIIVFLMMLLILSIPIVQKQFKGAFKRLSSIEAIAEGDITAGGTSARGDYSVKLFDLCKQHLLLGWGFSDFFKKNGQPHAGIVNILFSVGIVGYLVFIFFWYQLVSIPLRVNKLISPSNPFKGALSVLPLCFLIYFILNATSAQQFGVYLGFGPGIFSQSFYFCFSSFFISMALSTENQMQQEKLLTK